MDSAESQKCLSLLFDIVAGPTWLDAQTVPEHYNSFLFHQKGRFPGYLFDANYVAYIHFHAT